MSLPAPTEPHPAAPEMPSPSPWSRLARLGPWTGGLALAALSALAAGAVAWTLVEAFSALGAWSAPVAAAVGMLVLMLPLVAVLLKLARQVERSRQPWAPADADTVTGLPSRAQFMGLVEREWARARRYGSGAAVLLVDVDRFRRLCDTRGPEAGDAVLTELTSQTLPTLRGADAMARFGQAQLVIFLAQADPTGALDVAERIRERTEALEIVFGRQALRVTVSVGVAVFRPAHESAAALIEDAEHAVMAARQSGGNCVRAAPVDRSRLQTPGSSVGDNRAAGRSSPG